ncbi:FAD/NAD(P)-binding domain-containing protein [Mycena pura]|uniref:FAD/NAD(P)-binding domain-containing protein n=1 Tax=Mycena pura TaxID=153505 RepID=A0AAD7E4T7_9AGAR|nr:FAD/NAD(P)-binding domain-containing protein [Mycena pura]
MLTSDEALAIATQWLSSIGAATDAEAFARHVLPAGWLRDLLCFSWDFRTVAGSAKIAAFLAGSDQESGGQSRFARAGLHDFKLDTTSTIGAPALFTLPNNSAVHGVAGAFTFTVASPPAVGRGFFRLVRDTDGAWRAHTLFTNLEDLRGHDEPAVRPEGWADARAERIAEIERDPTVLILGAGQSGLMCAARFGKMGIRTLVLEKTARVGDVWRNRYPNLRLHTPSYHSYILYHPWPETYPKYLSKEEIADFLEAYATEQGIHVWLESQVLKGSTPAYDASAGRWSVEVDRAGTRVTLTPRHILLATGIGSPRIPTWPGMESFSGPIYHSDYHKGAAPFKGKRVVVVGACNAGADICHDCVSEGASEASGRSRLHRYVTMVQRSATCVLAANTADAALFRNLYPAHYSAYDADFVNNSTPPALMMKHAPGITQHFKALDQPLIDGLVKAGMKLTWELTPGGGEVGLVGFLFERAASGTLMDMGCGQLIIDGKIKIKQGFEIEKLEADGLVFSDGSKIEADAIVLATGYAPVIDTAVSIFGEEIKDTIGPKIWGLDEEGEITHCYRPTGAPGLWFALGAFQQLRFFSKHLAIQILADELGLKA